MLDSTLDIDSQNSLNIWDTQIDAGSTSSVTGNAGLGLK
jgi:hypothetical protein